MQSSELRSEQQADDVRARLAAEADARHASAYYVARTQLEAEILESAKPPFQASCITDPALGRDLPHGPGSHVVLINLPRLPDDLADSVELVEELTLPGGYRDVGEAVQYIGRPPADDDEAELLHDVWLGVTSAAQTEAIAENDNVAAEKPTLDVMFLSDLTKLGHRQPVVDGLLLEDSFNVLSGPPKAYKTTLGDALSVAVADGTDWLGRKVRQSGLVIDFALEGLMGKQPRYMAQIGTERWLDPEDPIHRRIALIRALPDITSVEGQDMVCRTIEHVQQVTGEDMQLLKLDTLARGIGLCGLDENSTHDMSAFVAGMDRIRMRFPSVQVALHHEGKNGQLRGNSALSGAYDLLMRSRPAGKFGATLSFPEARDIECPDDYDLLFQSVVVGEDDHGNLITAMKLAGASAAGSESDGNAARQNESAVRHALQQAHDVGLTVTQIAEATGIARTTLLGILDRIKSEVVRESEGRGHRYWLSRFKEPVEPTVENLSSASNSSASPPKHDGMESVDVSAPIYIGPTDTSSDSCGSTSPGDSWCTPTDILDAARGVLGGIDLDPATNAFAQTRVRAEEFFTVDDNGLLPEWYGKVWLNPPYSFPLIEKFVDKLIGHYSAGDLEAAILLVNNSSSAGWYQRALAASAMACLPSARIRFERPDGSGKGNSPAHSQALLYFGPQPERFKAVFASYGTITAEVA